MVSIALACIHDVLVRIDIVLVVGSLVVGWYVLLVWGHLRLIQKIILPIVDQFLVVLDRLLEKNGIVVHYAELRLREEGAPVEGVEHRPKLG